MATTTDILFISLYLGITLIFGLWMTKRASKNMDSYYLGGRSLPWWLLGCSGMAAWFDLTGTMVITSFLYMLGPRGLFVEFRGGAVLILAFMLCYAGKWHRRSGCMTMAEWMIFRFGEAKSSDLVRLLIALTGILGTLGMLAYLVRGCSLFVGMFFPEHMITITIGVVAIAALYTALSGFIGVVVTDFIQSLIIVAACVILSVLAFNLVGATPDFGTVAERVTGNDGWQGSAPSWETPMPAGYEPYRLLLLFAAFYLFRNVLGGMGSGAEQRFFAAKSDRDCGLQALLQGLMVALRWPMMMAFAVIGILYVDRVVPEQAELTQAREVIMAEEPDLRASDWHLFNAGLMGDDPAYDGLRMELENIMGPDYGAKLALLSSQGTVDPERILPAVLMHETPGLLRSLLLVAMLAALMSTLTTQVNLACSLFVRDIYQRHIRRRAKNRELILASYISTFVFVGIAYTMGMTAANINDIWGWVVMGLGGGSLGPLMLRLYWWRCNAAGMASGLLCGGVAAVLQRVIAPGMHEWGQFALTSGLSFGAVIIVSLLTRPARPEVLDDFFKKTRPFGFWGPVRARMNPEKMKGWKKENTNDIIAVPFTLLAQVTLFLMPMQLIVQQFEAFFVTLPLFLIGAAGMYIFWWKKLPPPGDDPVERFISPSVAAEHDDIPDLERSKQAAMERPASN